MYIYQSGVELLDSPSFIAHLWFSSNSRLPWPALPYLSSARPQEVPVVCTAIPCDRYGTGLFHKSVQRPTRYLLNL